MRVQGGTWRRNSRPGELALLVALGFILAGCSSSGPQSSDHHSAGYHRGQPSYKVGSPYQINGKWYTPQVDYGYDETGLASWYGAAFDGQATANGEIFNLNELSAAHKTLPLPSVVEVTNQQNGRSLQLRVNDRGPYVGDRVIDVSRRAAQLLGFEGAGTAPVHVRILKEPSIQVAEAAMRGETGQVRLAEATRATRPESTAAPRIERVARAEPAPPRATSVPPPPRAAEVVAANWPAAQPAPATQIVTAPLPEPPPRPSQIAAAPTPPELASPSPSPQIVAAPRRYFPSLISQAHAET